MQYDEQGGESKRAERHIGRMKRAAGEGAHVEGALNTKAMSRKADILRRIRNRRTPTQR